ncbi:MAG: hypothetical protein KC731_15130 [Myxococcales bacterium]|nr:hypothetical protein [Myxococcales bacterium]
MGERAETMTGVLRAGIAVVIAMATAGCQAPWVVPPSEPTSTSAAPSPLATTSAAGAADEVPDGDTVYRIGSLTPTHPRACPPL